MPKVNHEILSWARETAGLSLKEAVDKLGISPRLKVSAIDRLAAIEAGEVEPSRPLLVKMAQHYRRPLVTFYMSAPPRKGDRGEDFRNVPDRHTGAEALVDALVRDIRAGQSIKYGSRCAGRRRRGPATTLYRIDDYERWCRRGARLYSTNNTNRLV
jgi:transcriptional regulator with XRE-family HTH domain